MSVEQIARLGRSDVDADAAESGARLRKRAVDYDCKRKNKGAERSATRDLELGHRLNLRLSRTGNARDECPRFHLWSDHAASANLTATPVAAIRRRGAPSKSGRLIASTSKLRSITASA
jgi:hypothetical protein